MNIIQRLLGVTQDDKQTESMAQLHIRVDSETVLWENYRNSSKEQKKPRNRKNNNNKQ